MAELVKVACLPSDIFPVRGISFSSFTAATKMAKDKDVKPKWIPCQLMNPIKLSSLTTMRMKFRLLVCRGFIGVEDLFSKEPTNPKNNFFFGLHNGQFHSFFNVILPGLLSSVH